MSERNRHFVEADRVFSERVGKEAMLHVSDTLNGGALSHFLPGCTAPSFMP